jgi:hypothetical protein
MPSAAPVSDRSLHLWLSAVLGIWCGLFFSLGFQFSHPAIVVWVGVFFVTAPLLALATAVSHPKGRQATDLCTLMGILIALGCAAVTTHLGIGLSSGFVVVPLHRAIISLGIAGVLWGGPLVAIRFLVPWLILMIGAWVLLPWYGPFVSRPNRCRWCRFDQSGLPEHDVCPECGKTWKLPIARPLPDPSPRIVGLARFIVVLTAVGLVTSAVPHAVMAWHYRGLTIQRGDAYAHSSGWIGTVTSMSYTLTDPEGRSVCLSIVEDTEFGMGSQGQWQPLWSRLSDGRPDARFTPVEVRGLVPRADVLRALEAQTPP